MIPAHSTGYAMRANCFEEQLQDSFRPIVGVHANAGDETGEAVDETVDDELPAYKT